MPHGMSNRAHLTAGIPWCQQFAAQSAANGPVKKSPSRGSDTSRLGALEKPLVGASFLPSWQGDVEKNPERVMAIPLKRKPHKGNPPYPPLSGGYKKAMCPRRAEGTLLFLAPLLRGGRGGCFSDEKTKGDDARLVSFRIPTCRRERRGRIHATLVFSPTTRAACMRPLRNPPIPLVRGAFLALPL